MLNSLSNNFRRFIIDALFPTTFCDHLSHVSLLPKLLIFGTEEYGRCRCKHALFPLYAKGDNSKWEKALHLFCWKSKKHGKNLITLAFSLACLTSFLSIHRFLHFYNLLSSVSSLEKVVFFLLLSTLFHPCRHISIKHAAKSTWQSVGKTIRAFVLHTAL